MLCWVDRPVLYFSFIYIQTTQIKLVFISLPTLNSVLWATLLICHCLYAVCPLGPGLWFMQPLINLDSWRKSNQNPHKPKCSTSDSHIYRFFLCTFGTLANFLILLSPGLRPRTWPTSMYFVVRKAAQSSQQAEQTLHYHHQPPSSTLNVKSSDGGINIKF